MVTPSPAVAPPASPPSPAAASEASSAAEATRADLGLYLTGRPTLKKFLRYVRSNAVDPPSQAKLLDEWNAARSHVVGLERAEAGIADHPSISKLGDEHTALLGELLRDPLIRYGFNLVPTEVAMIDLERLVVYQRNIDLTFVAQLEAELPEPPDAEAIFRLCLPHDHPQPPVQWSRVPDDKYVFISPSNDLRFLGILPLESRDLPKVPPPGSLVGVVGIAVGFGSNFLNAIHVENRLVLRNGSHRAYLLWKRGIRHAPCIIQHVSSRDELEVVASSDLQRHPDQYLRDPRPPMLRDYFDPALHKVLPMQRKLRQIRVAFDVEESEIPAP